MEYSILSLTLEVLGYSNQRNHQRGDTRVRTFQRKLYLKAKQEKQFSFYVLYDKICLPHVMREAYRRVKANKGSPGIDGSTFESIEESGLDAFLSKLSEELRQGTYRPQAVLRVMIPRG
jgi:retron-type reverse transcriptase